MSDLLNKALYYHSKGLRPVALSEITRNAKGKKSFFPINPYAERRKRPFTEEDISNDFAPRAKNIGLLTGKDAGIVVLDVDPGADEDFIKTFIRKLPPTPTARTPRDGTHYFFKHPGFHVKTCAGQLARGIDVRGDNGLIIVEPSKLEDGSEYRFLLGFDEVELAEFPEWAKEKLNELNDQKNYENLLNRGCLVQGSRNDELTSFAGLIYKRFSDKPEVARDILFATNQYYSGLGKCELLPEKDLLAIIRGQEIKYHPKTVLENKLPPVVFLHEVKNLDFPKPTYKVEHLVPERSITVIFGIPGDYKSWVRTCISIACARGELLFGKYKTKKSKILLVDKDNDMYQMLSRFKMLGVDLENEKIDIAFYTLAFDFVIEDKSETDKLKKHIIENDIDIVIFDTFKDIFNGDENSSKDVGIVISFLKSLSVLNVTSILIHHTKKNTEDEVRDVAQLARGSTALWGGAHSMLFVHKPEKNENVLAIYHAKNKYGKAEQPILLNIEESGEEVKGFSYAGIAESYSSKGQSAQVQAEKQIFSLFTSSETELLRDNIVTLVKQKGCRVSAINENLGKLCKSERLAKRTEGKGSNRKTYYRLLKEGEG